MDKPIAWYDPSNGMVSTDQDCSLFTPLGQVWPLYAKEEAKDEPVAWMVYTQEGGSAFVTDNPAVIHPSQRALPLYATPIQRTWVGLTDEEQIEMYRKHSMDGWSFFYDAIEAKLKEKNA
jgi:hypothetical protein